MLSIINEENEGEKEEKKLQEQTGGACRWVCADEWRAGGTVVLILEIAQKWLIFVIFCISS